MKMLADHALADHARPTDGALMVRDGPPFPSILRWVCGVADQTDVNESTLYCG